MTAARGIPFSVDMVRAERAGRKTNTRRVITPKWARCLDLDDPEDRARAIEMCPYGKPGDRLYVREPLRPKTLGGHELAVYAATPNDLVVSAENGHLVWWPWKARYIASRYCPRWASRTTLELVDVRIERVQDISEEDAFAEGVRGGSCCRCGDEVGDDEDSCSHRDGHCECWWDSSAINEFEMLWDSINAARGFGWDANPHVWVLVFRRAAHV